jgi:hypothetical protein
VETFEAVIEEARGGGAYVAVPADVDAALGGKGRIPVVASFDGVEYRGSVVTMGGVRCLGVLKAIRDRLGKGPGDTVTVTLAPDAAERTVTVPDDLAAALADAGARAIFDRLSYSHRREYVTWIDDAKKPATRARRVAGTVERLTAG